MSPASPHPGSATDPLFPFRVKNPVEAPGPLLPAHSEVRDPVLCSFHTLKCVALDCSLNTGVDRGLATVGEGCMMAWGGELNPARKEWCSPALLQSGFSLLPGSMMVSAQMNPHLCDSCPLSCFIFSIALITTWHIIDLFIVHYFPLTFPTKARAMIYSKI